MIKPFTKGRYNEMFRLPIAWILIVLFMSPLVDNDFANGWDDEQQITQNKDIHSFSTESVKAWFSKFYVGMYQPLTTASYALDYKIGGLNPKVFHLMSLLYHLLNVMLVYLFFRNLSGSKNLALGVALLFGLHPMNVETVAWLSARSNLLYTAFFLGALLFWWRALQTKKWSFKLWSFLLFGLSLLSKTPAVTLPAVLILMDYYSGRKDHRRIWLEKIPFVLLSLLFIRIAFAARAEVSHMWSLSEQYSFFQSVVLILWSYAFYVFKLFWPVHLSPLYYYPGTFDGGIGLIHYLGAAFSLLLFGFFIYRLIRALYSGKWKDAVLFGLGFFLINISVVIHFVPVGIQVVAERYVYLPYLGLFFIIVYGLQGVETKNRKIYRSLLYTGGIILLLFGLLSRSYIRRWKNTETLMTAVVKEHPATWHALVVRGDAYYWQHKDRLAMADYNRAALSARAYPNLYLNRGSLYARNHQYQKALEDFRYAISLDSTLSQAWFNMALADFNLGNYPQSVKAFSQAIVLDSTYELAYLYRGVAYGVMNELNKSSADLEKCVGINPENARAWSSLGVLAYKRQQFEQAEDFYSRSLKLNPKDAGVWLNRGLCRMRLQKTDAACKDFRKARSLGSAKAAKYIEKYCRNY